MKRSVFRKYFTICFVCVTVSILVLGVILLAFSTRFFERDRYDNLNRNATELAKITAESYENNGEVIYLDILMPAYRVFTRTMDAELFITDNAGVLVYHTSPGDLDPESDLALPPAIVEAVSAKGYENTGIMPGITKNASYIVGVPIVSDGHQIAALFMLTSADSLSIYLKEVVKMFLLSSAIVLLLAFLLTYYVTAHMAKPLKQMVDATHSFAQGDFSQRIPVHGYDEVGQLAMAFNNMASTLAVNEGSRRSFIGNVSHELKTPMTTIAGFVDGILDGTIPPEKQSDYLAIVSSEVQRLSRLVHSMLDTARIEAGEMELEKKVFDISELVRQSIFSFEIKVEEKNLTMTGLEEDRIMVVADKDLMHQVVYNLLENAVKFVEVGGEISVQYEQRGNMMYTSIRNTGSGLSKEESTRIFERFYKSDRSRTTATGGAGLGLHIVKSIIQYHNGEITAHSVEGQYTEFTFGIAAATPETGKNQSGGQGQPTT